MKILSTEGLTKLIQLIKNSFISVDDTVTTTTTDIKTINNTSLLGSGNIIVANTTLSNVSNGLVWVSEDDTALFTWYLDNVGIYGTTSGYPSAGDAVYDIDYINKIARKSSKTVTQFDSTNNTISISHVTGTFTYYSVEQFSLRQKLVQSSNIYSGVPLTLPYVNKSGDTMTGALTINVDTQNQLMLVNPYITKGTNPSERKYYGLYFNDSQNLSVDNWKDTRLGGIETSVQTNGTVTTTIQAVQNVAGNTATAAWLNLSMTSNGVASCSFPNTTCCDGQWVAKYLSVFSGVTAVGNGDYSISSYLPNDGQAYEVLACMQMNDDGTTSGSDSAAAVGNVAKPIDNNCFRIYGNSDKGIWKPRFNGILVFLGNQRKVYYQITGRALHQGLVLWFFGYRRIGTNS